MTCAPTPSNAWPPPSARAPWPSPSSTVTWRRNERPSTPGTTSAACSCSSPSTTSQLRLIADCGRVIPCPAGTRVYEEGQPATCSVVLLEGTITLTRRRPGRRRRVHPQRPARRLRRCDAGVHEPGGSPREYNNSMVALTDVTVYEIPADSFAEWTRASGSRWRCTCSRGLFVGMRAPPRRRSASGNACFALGALSAGLTHELNNPAAAAVRGHLDLAARAGGRDAAQARHDRRRQDRRRPAAEARRAPGTRRQAGRLRPRAAAALQTSDAEDALADWLDDPRHRRVVGHRAHPRRRGESPLGVAAADPSRSASGRGTWRGAIGGGTGSTIGTPSSSWARSTTRCPGSPAWSPPPSSIRSSTACRTRRSSVHDLLDATLTVLQAKIPEGHGWSSWRLRLPPCPRSPPTPPELSQVWTNLIDRNAIGAMEDPGTLTIFATGADRLPRGTEITRL